MEFKLFVAYIEQWMELGELIAVPLALYLLRHKGVAARARTDIELERRKKLHAGYR